jgi:hypothetical protein
MGRTACPEDSLQVRFRAMTDVLTRCNKRGVCAHRNGRVGDVWLVVASPGCRGFPCGCSRRPSSINPSTVASATPASIDDLGVSGAFESSYNRRVLADVAGRRPVRAPAAAGRPLGLSP